MTCKYCNALIGDSSKFCSECGMALSEAEQVSAAKVRHKGKTLLIGAVFAVLLLIFAALFTADYFGDSAKSKLKGTWQRDSVGTTSAEIIAYTFNTKIGEARYSQDMSADSTDSLVFDWFVTDDDELILLWSNTSCTKYSWNPNIGNNSLSSTDYSWYVKGDTLYISSTSAENGYYTYQKQGM